MATRTPFTMRSTESTLRDHPTALRVVAELEAPLVGSVPPTKRPVCVAVVHDAAVQMS